MIIIPGKIKMFPMAEEKSLLTTVSTSLSRSYQMFCTYSNHVEDIMAVTIG